MTRVALLSVTHERQEWIPWLYDRLRVQAETLGKGCETRAFLVDSSEAPAPDNELVTVAHVPGMQPIAPKRSLALSLAKAWQPDFFAWLDDDDWSHPCRLLNGVGCLQANPAFWAVGNRVAPMIDAVSLKSWDHRAPEHLIFNGAVYRWGNPPAFDSGLITGEDTAWSERYLRRLSYMVLGEPMHAWLCHGKNITNRADRHLFDQPFPGTFSRFRLTFERNPARVKGR